MSIRNKCKDHLKDHAGVELVEPTLEPQSNDPLRFWSGHPTENCLINLHPFADGETKNPHSNGGGSWAGPFSGRPQLILEIAPALQARCTLAARETCKKYLPALRRWWRLFDALEAIPSPDGQTLPRLESIADLNVLHEAAALRNGIGNGAFKLFLSVANDARLLGKPRLSKLLWAVPERGEPERKLIPDDQAKALRIAIKQDWERVRHTWTRHDEIRNRLRPRPLPDQPTEREFKEYEEDLYLLKNWQHFQRIQQTCGGILPSPEQLCEGYSSRSMSSNRGVELRLMRAIVFPTTDEANTAFHTALMGSGWNPSTLITGIDATQPHRIFEHPKDVRQAVLSIEEAEEVTMQGSKRRAGGRMQFCMGLKKNPSSPPAVVAAYLNRSELLRQQLRRNCDASRAELARLTASGAPQEAIERQFMHVNTLQQGVRNIWLHIDHFGRINWINGEKWARYSDSISSNRVSYLDRIIERLNTDRTKRGERAIAKVMPSDFRDIYTRWAYNQSGGNIIAVMFALGHASLRSTNNYTDNNIFNAEADEAVRRFMTHLFKELEQGRVDLTILAQLVRHGPLTPEMQCRLEEYRHLMHSRIKVGCANPKKPPTHISPDHVEGEWCTTHHCLRDCPNARFLPESVDGIAMRVEELMVMSHHLPLETWMRGNFQKELEAGEYLLAELYSPETVNKARAMWRAKIAGGLHTISGVGLIRGQDAA